MQPATKPRVPGSRREWTAAAILAAVAFAVFSPALGCEFVNFDDPVYASTNPHVQGGLSVQNIGWAFTTFELSNWHPLTWLSLQLDATFWKKDPFGFHLTSVLLHSANAALLFVALRSLTGAFWRSAAVALLFAVHPLRAESVAWVAERKDVLSVFFGLLALWAYADYVRRPSAWRYAAVAAAFAASLMCKPMLVTLPLLLLVLDWWPLGRVPTLRDWRRPVLEKLPLLALTALVSVVTYRAQTEQGAVLGLEAIPTATRLANVAVSYLTYLEKTIWPANLAVYYPYPKEVWLPRAVAAAAFLAAATGGAVALRRRAPYLLAGWLWYVGTLVPVIGLVQAGDQAHADRYSYFPQVGVLLALCWGVAELARRKEGAAATAAAVAAVLLAAVTSSQLQYWHDSVALWDRDVRVADPSPTAFINLGEACTEKKNTAGAVAAYRRAIELDPNSLPARLNLGSLLYLQGDPDAAADQFRAACDAHPDSAPAHTYLAELLIRQKKLAEAVRVYEIVSHLTPDPTDAYCKLGRIELMRGDLTRATGWLKKAQDVQPDSAAAHAGLGVVLMQQNRLEESADSLFRAVERDPKSREYREALNAVLNRLAATGRSDLARQISERLNRL